MTSRDHMMTSRDHLGRPNSEITFLILAHRKINLYMRYGAQMKGLEYAHLDKAERIT